MITHDMHLMLEYTPHAIVVSGGQKIGDSTAVDILTNEEIADAASLKLTSLYDLALMADIEDPQGFVQHFIDFDRSMRNISGRTAEEGSGSGGEGGDRDEG
jgi:energy-coupling factor transport system ATP-binding protein